MKYTQKIYDTAYNVLTLTKKLINFAQENPEYTALAIGCSFVNFATAVTNPIITCQSLANQMQNLNQGANEACNWQKLQEAYFYGSTNLSPVERKEQLFFEYTSTCTEVKNIGCDGLYDQYCNSIPPCINIM